MVTKKEHIEIENAFHCVYGSKTKLLVKLADHLEKKNIPYTIWFDSDSIELVIKKNHHDKPVECHVSTVKGKYKLIAYCVKDLDIGLDIVEIHNEDDLTMTKISSAIKKIMKNSDQFWGHDNLPENVQSIFSYKKK